MFIGNEMKTFQKNNKFNALDDILNEKGNSFIISAYQSILGREPDTEGYTYYDSRLRDGVSKIEILTQLRESQEGKLFASNISGLEEAIKIFHRVKIPIIGIFFGKEKFYNSHSSRSSALRRLEYKIEESQENNFEKINEIDSKLMNLNNSLASILENQINIV